MKRAQIKAGVVYARYQRGRPEPMVFLENGGARVWERSRHGTIRDVTSLGRKIGSRMSGSTGYAAVMVNLFGDLAELPYDERVKSLEGLDVAAELERFLAREQPSRPGLSFFLVTFMGSVHGEFRAEMTAYIEAQQREQRLRDEASDQRQADIDRTDRAITEYRARMAELGAATPSVHRNGRATVVIGVEEFETLVKTLRDGY